MKALDVARERVRSLVRQEGTAFVAGTGLLVVGGLLSVPALMFAGLVLLAISRRVLATLEKMRSLVFGLELARDASEREDSPVVVVAPLAAPGPEPDARATPLAIRALAAAAVVTALAVFASFFSTSPAPKHQRWTFMDDSFATADTWSIEHHAAATGGRALSKEAGASALLVVTATSARDVRAMTRCKGDGCGLAFRIADERTHSIARVVGSRLELVIVANGAEKVVASSALSSSSADVWQELAIEARGDLVRVTVNGVRAIDHHDPRPAIAGGVGLWAPSRAWFDELTIETLATSPQAIEVLPFLRRPS
jgi:hypothetical protein